MQLYLLVVGCKPDGRHTEQHDIFFGVGHSLADLVPQLRSFWPEAHDSLHLDSWRKVTCVDQYSVHIVPRSSQEFTAEPSAVKLFFINLGGYKPDDLEEYHYKMVMACTSKAEAVQRAKQSAFYLHTRFGPAVSHIDDKYGIDVDDLFEIEDILPQSIKDRYAIALRPSPVSVADELHIGYQKLSSLR